MYHHGKIEKYVDLALPSHVSALTEITARGSRQTGPKPALSCSQSSRQLHLQVQSGWLPTTVVGILFSTTQGQPKARIEVYEECDAAISSVMDAVTCSVYETHSLRRHDFLMMNAVFCA